MNSSAHKTEQYRILSGSHKGTTPNKNYPAKLTYTNFPQPAENYDRQTAMQNTTPKPIKLQELLKGRVSNKKTGKVTKNEVCEENDFPKTVFTKNTTPTNETKSYSPFRAKSANQRTLGVTRGIGTYTSEMLVEKQLTDINQWRSLTPDCMSSSSRQIHRMQQRKGSFNYYGQTRINLDDPAGLFYKCDLPNNPIPGKHTEQKPRKEMASPVINEIKSDKSCQHKWHSEKCRTGLQQYQYHLPMSKTRLSSKTIESALKKVLEKQISSPMNSEPFKVNRREADPLKYKCRRKLSPSHVHTARKLLYNNNKKAITNQDTSNDNSGCSRTNTNSSPQREIQLPPNNSSVGICEIFCSNSRNENATIEGENSPSDGTSNAEEINENSSDTVMPASKSFSDSSNGEAAVCPAFSLTQEENCDMYTLPLPKQQVEDLTRSKYFLLHATKKPRKRSVRFKVRDDIHEYEPWSPIESSS